MEALTLFISTEVFVAHFEDWSGRIGSEVRFKAICESYDLSFVTASESGGGTRINAKHAMANVRFSSNCNMLVSGVHG